MSVQRGLLSVLAVAGLCAVPALFYYGTAVAQPETEKLVARNPLIDCSTNPAYENKYIASAFRAGGGHAGGRNQQCSACHQSDRPQVGEGDRPRATAGTALIRNRTSTTVGFSVKYGDGEWKRYTLGPGDVERVSYRYEFVNQNRSPDVWIKYRGPNGEQVSKIMLIASPNKRLGSVYFFDRDDKGEIDMWKPSEQVARR